MTNQKTAGAQTEIKSGVPKLKNNRLLILIGGSKGGPGKSTVARALADILANRKVQFTAIDSDTENSQLYRHYGKSLAVQRIDITDSETVVDFLRDLSIEGSDEEELKVLAKPPERLVLVDLPSAAEGKFRTFEDDFGLLSSLDGIGWDATFVNVMSTIKDSVNALRLLLELAEGHPNAHTIAIQNLHFGEDRKFEIFHKSETKKALQEKGLMLAFPKLDADTYSEIDRLDLSFRAAADRDSSLFIVNRGYVFKWLEKLEKQLEPAGAWLGL